MTRYKAFTKEFNKYVKLLNLLDWNIMWCPDSDMDAVAQLTVFSIVDRSVVVEVNPGKLSSVAAAKQAARHEAFHLFTTMLSSMILGSGTFTEEDVRLEMERLAYVFQKYHLVVDIL